MFIILTNNADQSTNQIIKWFNYYDKTYIRINQEQKIRDFTLSNNLQSYSFNFEGKTIMSDNIEGYWYRKGHIQIENDINLSKIEDKNLAREFIENLYMVGETITEFIHYQLMNNNNKIGSFFTRRMNKLVLLRIAEKIGLMIPNTIIVNTKKELLSFKNQQKRIITKSIEDSFHYEVGDLMVLMYTDEITDEVFDKIPNQFYPSMFQQLIDKKYELRVFYLKGKCYTMAIFSQQDQQTKIDFRHYNNEKPNRTVPFNLPKTIEYKLDILMKELKLDSGSIDIVVSTKNDYYFLEVNAVGQFGMTSYPCNYFLEEKIVKNLINGTK